MSLAPPQEKGVRTARASSAPGPAHGRAQRNDLSLAALQDLFQQAVLAGDATILDCIPGNGRTSAEVLLGVYQHAYRSRLIDVLSADHPILLAHMGETDFAAMADAYVTAYPSDRQNVRWFSRHLPEFLRATTPYCDKGDIFELASLERATTNAFDAADGPLLVFEHLQSVSPEGWAGLTFEAHPSAARLTCQFNTFARWKSFMGDDEPPGIETLAQPELLIVWRKNDTARVRQMPNEEAMMWDEAKRGVPFGRLCELVATFDDPETAPLRAAQYLQGWINAELLVATGDQAATPEQR